MSEAQDKMEGVLLLVPSDLLDELNTIARITDRPRAKHMRQALREYVERYYGVSQPEEADARAAA